MQLVTPQLIDPKGGLGLLVVSVGPLTLQLVVYPEMVCAVAVVEKVAAVQVLVELDDKEKLVPQSPTALVADICAVEKTPVKLNLKVELLHV